MTETIPTTTSDSRCGVESFAVYISIITVIITCLLCLLLTTTFHLCIIKEPYVNCNPGNLVCCPDVGAILPAQDRREGRGAAAAHANASLGRYPRGGHRGRDRDLQPALGEVVHARLSDPVQRRHAPAAALQVRGSGETLHEFKFHFRGDLHGIFNFLLI